MMIAKLRQASSQKLRLTTGLIKLISQKLGGSTFTD